MMPTQIGRYQIKKLLGQGGMATVYHAYDPITERNVAAKVLPAEFLQDEEFLTRFQREMGIAASLQHPAIVPVYDSGENNGRPYIVMPLMNGGSLQDRLKQGELPLDQLAQILAALAPALDHLHKKGFIHRDIKPSNILFDNNYNPYMADFGLARHIEQTQITNSGHLLGTLPYMSPEQVDNPSKLDGASDIYSLGCVLFKMLTGQAPYHKAPPLMLPYHHTSEPPPRLNQLRHDLAPTWQVIIDRAMAKKPEERYSTAKKLSEAVQFAAQQQSQKNQQEQAQQQALPPWLPVLTGIALGLLVLGLVLLAISYLIQFLV